MGYRPEYLGLRGLGDGRACLDVVVQEGTNGGEGFGLKAKHFLAICLTKKREYCEVQIKL